MCAPSMGAGEWPRPRFAGDRNPNGLEFGPDLHPVLRRVYAARGVFRVARISIYRWSGCCR